MSKRLGATAMLLALAMSLFASAAMAQERPPPFNQPHNHVLLVGADVEWVEPAPGVPPYRIHGFDKCVPLANGKPVPLNAHHDRVHFGTAGEALVGAGHLVVPLGIFEFSSCAELEGALPFP